ncbi:MAG: hypothetical protein R3E96_02665 [Planctomycetota bacterium]
MSETFLEHAWCTSSTAPAATPTWNSAPRPGAGIALVKASRARALIHGRHYVVPEDLYALSEDVILHRIRPTYEALAEGRTNQAILAEILNESGRG